MAKAISARPQPPANGSRRSRAGPALPESLEASADSLRGLLELIRLLDEKGYLRLGTDVLRSEDRMISVLTERVDPADVRALVRSVQRLGAVLGPVDPEAARWLGRRLPNALVGARHGETEPPLAALDIVKALGEPEVNRGVRMVLGFLRGFGRDPDG